MFGRTLEKFVNHSPAARDLQTFLVFSQTSQVGYYPYKPTESVVYCFHKITSYKAHYVSGEIVFLIT